jgi:hypothetical protein
MICNDMLFEKKIVHDFKEYQIPRGAHHLRPSCDNRRSRYRVYGRKPAAGASFSVGFEVQGCTSAAEDKDVERRLWTSKK